MLQKKHLPKSKEKTLPSLIRLGRVSPYFFIFIYNTRIPGDKEAHARASTHPHACSNSKHWSEVHGSKILKLLSLWHRPWQLETLFSIIKGAVVADQLPFTGRWLSWGHRFAWRISKRLKWPCGKRSTNYLQLHPITANYHLKLAPITLPISII